MKGMGLVPVWSPQLHDRNKLQQAQMTNVTQIQKLGVFTEVLFTAMAYSPSLQEQMSSGSTSRHEIKVKVRLTIPSLLTLLIQISSTLE